VRNLGRTIPPIFDLCREFVETRPTEIVAVIAICLIHQADDLFDRQLLRLEKDHIEQDGLRERMPRARLRHRNMRKKSDSSALTGVAPCAQTSPSTSGFTESVQRHITFSWPQ